MKPFSAPVDDIMFTLEHVADAPRLELFDAELSRDVIDDPGLTPVLPLLNDIARSEAACPT